MSDRLRHRLARLARAQNISAAQLRTLVALDPELAMVEHASTIVLDSLDLTTSARDWLRSPDLARVRAASGLLFVEREETLCHITSLRRTRYREHRTR